MSPWSWFAGDPDMESYGLAEEASREAVIAAALKELEPGDVFEIIEARSSDAKKYDGGDFVPLLRTRNHELLTVSEDGKSALRDHPLKGLKMNSSLQAQGPFVPTEAALSAAPHRVQLSRAKGWRMPENTVKVDRTTRFGNPWTEGDPGKVRIVKGCEINLPMAVTRAGVIDRFRRWLAGEFDQTHGHPIYEAVIPPQSPKPDLAALRGKNLACWCPLDKPCHADVLLELANGEPR